MAERKLATVRRIDEINPIEGADMIEVLTLDGWEVVASKKEGHKVGDLVVYLETDSFLPLWPEFNFLEKNSLRKMGDRAGYRLRTIKLRGQVSEGLVIPLERKLNAWILNIESQDIRKVVELDEEVTELLNVIKWELPVHASLGGVAKGNFPTFIPKTDQERIENFYKYYIRHYSEHLWEVTLKLDGSSFTSYFNDDVFGVCSRNLDLVESEGNSFWIAARKYDLETKLRGLGRNLAIQGELMGPGVQGNREQLKELDIYVFDIYDIDNRTKLDAKERALIVAQLGLKSVPVLTVTRFAFNSAKDFLGTIEGPSINHPIREGLVFKSLDDPNVSFKAISKTFLLKVKD